MFKVTNNSGAILTVGGRTLGPKQSIVITTIPKDLHAVAQFVSVEPYQDGSTIEKAKEATAKSKKNKRDVAPVQSSDAGGSN